MIGFYGKWLEYEKPKILFTSRQVPPRILEKFVFFEQICSRYSLESVKNIYIYIDIPEQIFQIFNNKLCLFYR